MSGREVLVAGIRGELAGEITPALEEAGYTVLLVRETGNALEMIDGGFTGVVAVEVSGESCGKEGFIVKAGESGAREQIRIIALCGKSPSDLISEGADDFIIEPFFPEEFLQRVKVNHELLSLKSGGNSAPEKELLRAERFAAIKKLSSGVGHELKNPLASIKNAVFYLQNYVEIDDPDVKEFIGTLSDEVEVSDKILTELLEFSRKITFSIREFDIRQAAEDAAKAVSLPDNIELKFLEKSGDLKIRFDPGRLKQIFEYIFHNSCQAMPEGGSIKVEAFTEEENYFIRVSDTGPGLTPEALKNVFEPLYSSNPKGIGLGTSVVKHIVESFGGIISASNSETGGAVFEIRLPVPEGDSG